MNAREKKMICAALAWLTPLEEEIYLAHEGIHGERRSIRKIARLLGKGRGAVVYRLKKAKEKLPKILKFIGED